jgi:hypothetical protein
MTNVVARARKLVKILSIQEQEVEKITQLIKKVKILVPFPQYNLFTSPKELHFIGQGLFKIVFKYGDQAIKYFKFKRVGERDVQKFQALSKLKTFEKFTMHSTKWFATDFIEGVSLKKIGRTQESLKRSAVGKVKEDMLACLKLGWAPNDLHFNNFLVEPSGCIRCIDVDLFTDMRDWDDAKRERITEAARGRVEALDKKMLRYTC